MDWNAMIKKLIGMIEQVPYDRVQDLYNQLAEETCSPHVEYVYPHDDSESPDWIEL